ncbi:MULTISPECIES: NADPH dehydrogenase NamA [Cytobacillus]|uniref:NADPH dehydrogenase n=2 Tax=Cytobacillus TaxID=2675230 RepID=A0ABX3CU87_9BACI|nr:MULTISPECIES: NADPH dehydrogenase NamA [Cytobacillus]EFV77691.1 YqjM protein [Bacillus sp. 2_A_57_CT2]MBY0154602.1 NADPH dehydrogenase NamA [Cytobacillus firmus]MBU8731391.1 NADPH dehydrogenase NamA [Cytobacillus oceanisediminis]MCM3243702.1 NADPH dehydrogenase NamA [Cytobacillus oceanisediminis]MCM3393821.1 NADPH dehydrogenase NamA [Cytobacillus oceanisediminis]
METKLFSPLTIKGITFKNRIVMAPMCMYSSHNEDGMVENWHRTHYTSRAVGQVGLIILEATAVTPQGRISPQDLGIWNDDHIAGLKELTGLMKEHGASAGIQLAHAGRKATVEGEILAPSAIAFNEKMKTPKEMTKEEVSETVEAFKKGAERAKKAGFEVIEIHAAHGYLINEFLSPLSNKRSDEYGGSAENRYRFLREVIEAVKTVWGGPLFVRVSAHDYHDEGLTAEDYAEMGKWMKEQGVDLIDVSSGAVVPARINSYPGYQVKFSETIKEGANIQTGAVGLITSGLQAEEILQNGRADLIFIARELLRDPYWPRTAAKELGAAIEPPKQYERGWI